MNRISGRIACIRKISLTLCLFLAASLVSGKSTGIFKLDNVTEVDNVKTIGAKKEFSGGSMKVSFSAEKYSFVYLDVPRKDPIYWDGKPRNASKLVNLTLPENVWTGYEKLLFDYNNESGADIDVKVWIIDRIGYVSKLDFNRLITQIRSSDTREITYKQMGEVVLTIKQGRGTGTVDLTGIIKTADKKRRIDISDIRAIAFAGAEKEAVINIGNVRLESNLDTAGTVPSYPCTVFCSKYPDKGYHDKRANLCPYCGEEFPDAPAPVVADGSVKIPALQSADVTPLGGGGEERMSAGAKTSETAIYHFDNGMDELFYLDFDINPEALKNIKKAELRLLGYFTSKTEQPRITSAIKLYSTKNFKFNEKNFKWISQPPVDELLSISGNYVIKEQNVHPNAVPYVFDITEYLKKTVELKKSNLCLKFQGWTTINSCGVLDPTAVECNVYFVARSIRGDERKRPYIYVEFQESK